jgi:hypothetical protein
MSMLATHYPLLLLEMEVTHGFQLRLTAEQVRTVSRALPRRSIHHRLFCSILGSRYVDGYELAQQLRALSVTAGVQL